MRKANDAVVGSPNDHTPYPHIIGETRMHATASVAHGTCDSSITASCTWDAPASAEEMDRLEGVSESDGSFAKGALVALGIEAAMVLLVCGVWQIWHLIR
ncbi:MAG: hypothetical protein ACLPY1_19865 [Terracidiphilus sp.]